MRIIYLSILLVCGCGVQKQQHSMRRQNNCLKEIRTDSLRLNQLLKGKDERIWKIRHIEWMSRDTLSGNVPEIKSVTCIDMVEKQEEEIYSRITEDKKMESRQDIQTHVETGNKMKSGINPFFRTGIFLIGIVLFVVIRRLYFHR